MHGCFYLRLPFLIDEPRSTMTEFQKGVAVGAVGSIVSLIVFAWLCLQVVSFFWES